SQAVGIDFNSSLKTGYRFFVRSVRQLAVKEWRQRSLDPADSGEHHVPAPQHVPGQIILGIELDCLVRRIFDNMRGLGLLLWPLKRQQFSAANRKRELSLGVIGGYRHRSLCVIQRDSAKPELLLPVFG